MQNTAQPRDMLERTKGEKYILNKVKESERERGDFDRARKARKLPRLYLIIFTYNEMHSGVL